MTHLLTRAQELIDAGRLPVPGRGLALLTDWEDPRQRYTSDDFNHPRVTDVQIRLGLQLSGRYLYMADLDSHHKGQDADAARAAFERLYPQIAHKLDWKRSRSGTGWHAFFESTTKLDTGKLYDLDGQHIGDLLGGDTDRTLDPGDLNPGWLSKTETDQLRSAWLVRGVVPGGVRWSERACEGKRWAAGYQHQHVTRPMLRDFLIGLDTNTSRSLAQKLTTATVGERSDLAGNLMQCLMFNAHKLPCGWHADFHVKCRTVMAYWMAADSYGKAAEKDYSQEKDGWSLIAQIVHGDPHQNGGKWTCPFWAKSQAPRVPAPEPEPEPKRPAHRPAGDQAKQIARLRRVLESIEPDDFGRRVYTLDYLAERCGARPRTIQVYLKILRDGSEIVTAQIAGNGRPYTVLTACFGGADKSAKPDKPSAPAPIIWGADVTPTERVETPKNVESLPQCIGDHQNGRVPPAPPAAPGRAQGAGDPPCAPAGAPPTRRLSLAERVRQAFDLVKVDQDTGEKQRATRRRLYIALGPLTWSDAAIDAAIAEERERRRIEAIVFDIGQLRLNALKAQIRLMEHLAEKSRRDGTNLYKYAEWAAREMRRELASRPAQPGRRARVVCEVLPDARQVAELQQAELLDFADAALAELRAQRQGRPRGGVCSPQPTTDMPAALVEGPRNNTEVHTYGNTAANARPGTLGTTRLAHSRSP